MENKSNSKITLLVVAYATVILSGFFTAININNTSSLTTFKIDGFAIILFTYCVLLYAVSTNKKLLSYLFYLTTLAIYGYSLYSIYQMYDSTISLDIGLYLYAASLFIFIISIFMKTPKKVDKKEIALEDEFVPIKNNNINPNDHKYIYGTYLYGIGGCKEYSNHRCAITIVNNNLFIILSNEKTVNYELKNEQIKNITCSTRLSMKKKNEDSAKYATQDKMLGYALGDLIGLTIAENTTINELGNKVDYSASYLIEINYKINDEIQRIVLTLDLNPDKLLNKFGNKYIRKA